MKRIASAAVIMLCVFFVAVPPNLIASEASTDQEIIDVTTSDSEIVLETPALEEGVDGTTEPSLTETPLPTEEPALPDAPTEPPATVPTEPVPGEEEPTTAPAEPTPTEAATLEPTTEAMDDEVATPTEVMLTPPSNQGENDADDLATPDDASQDASNPEAQGTPQANMMMYGEVTVSVSPEIVMPRDVVRVTGSGFLPGEKVVITWPDYYTPPLGYVDAAPDGSASGRVTIPASFDDDSPGYAIHMTGSTSKATGYGVVYVATHKEKTASLSVSEANAGDVVRVTGSGFHPGERVEIRWNSSSGALRGYVNADSSGSMSGALRVPPTASGGATHQVVLVAPSGQASAPLFVIAPPRAKTTLSTYEGFAGDVITVYGTNYMPGEVVTISWPGGRVLGRVTVRPDGGFTGRITIPTTAYMAPYTITSTGNTSGFVSGARFTTLGWVAPTVQLTASQGKAGSIVRFNGSGFQPGERVNVIWDADRVIGIVTVSPGGTISGAVTIPRYANVGNHIISFDALSSGQFEFRNYYVTAQLPATLTVDPIRTTGGSVVRVIGSGFAPGETVTLRWDDPYGHLMGVVTASPSGTISGRVTIPSWALRGVHWIHGRGNSSGLQPQALVSVTQNPVAKVNLSPTSGRRLSTVTVTGSGFGSYEVVTITWGVGGNPVGYVSTTSTGTFNARITVPSSASAGSVRVVARGDTSNQNANATFTVVVPAPVPAPPPPPSFAPDPPAVNECDPHYPTVCIPPKWLVGDLNCDSPLIKGKGYRYFRVLQPDPHRLDRDKDGWGCETN